MSFGMCAGAVFMVFMDFMVMAVGVKNRVEIVNGMDVGVDVNMEVRTPPLGFLLRARTRIVP